MNKIATHLFVLLGLTSFDLHADGAPVQHQFQGGQPASASQVNENFQELADRIADVPGNQSYDYRDYMSTASEKVFAYFQSGYPDCDTETRSYQRTVNGSNTEIEMTRVWSGSGMGTCNQQQVSYFLATPQYYMQTGYDSYDSNNVYTSNTRLTPGSVYASSNMKIGIMYSVDLEKYRTPDMSSEEYQGPEIADIVLIGIEDVTVAYGSFSNCLKIRRSISTYVQLHWRCPGVGLVKRIDNSLGSGGTVMRKYELTGMTP